MALGATPADVLRLVMSDGVRLVVVGLTAGVIAAYFAVRLFAGFLVGVSARDPLTFTSVAVLLAGVSLVACAIPAVRAIRIEPVDALREE
jgi:ABC-type lipoprotein release transport system permease subunit